MDLTCVEAGLDLTMAALFLAVLLFASTMATPGRGQMSTGEKIALGKWILIKIFQNAKQIFRGFFKIPIQNNCTYYLQVSFQINTSSSFLSDNRKTFSVYGQE